MDSVRTAVLAEKTPVDGDGVTVAVLDTGIDSGHPDLVHALDTAASRSFSLRPDLDDRHGHGTHICGIIAGSGAASGGLYRGIAPGVRLIVLKVVEEQRGRDHGIPPAVEAAVELGADIISYSGGQRGPHPGPWKWPRQLGLRDRAFSWAAEQGVLCLAAAGNDGWWGAGPVPGTVIRPANLPGVLAVGSTLGRGPVSPSSGRGPVYVDDRLRVNQVARLEGTLDQPFVTEARNKPDLVCPGERERVRPDAPLGIISARGAAAIAVEPLDPLDHAHPYGRYGGTSQATAVAAGLAALGFAYARRIGVDLGPNPGLAMKRILCKSTMPLDSGGLLDFGHGILLWPHLQTTIEDCLDDEQMRQAVTGPGPTLWEP